MVRLARGVLGVLLAALALEVWSSFYWSLWLDRGAADKAYADQEGIDFLRSSFPEPGTYTIQSREDDGSNQTIAFLEILSRPPVLRKTPVRAIRLMQFLLPACLMLLLLKAVSVALATRWDQLGFVLLSGFAVVLSHLLADPLWWHSPMRWTAARNLYELSSWWILGMISCYILRPRAEWGSFPITAWPFRLGKPSTSEAEPPIPQS